MQVPNRLPDAHELDGHAELVHDADHRPAPRGPVQLGEDDAGDVHHLVELPRLVQHVQAGGAVEHQRDFVRRPLHAPADGLLDPRELVHQVAVGVEPAGGIREDDVDIPHLDRLVHRRVAQRAGLHALLVFRHDSVGSFRPRRELLGGGGAERIARHEHHLRAALLGEAV